MKNERFIIRYTSENNCFAYLPDYCLQHSEGKITVIQMTYKEQHYFLSCRIKNSTSNNLYLNALFSKSLGIEDKEEVFVSYIDNYGPELRSISVISKTEHDREIIELHFEKVQSSLLNQINIVAVNQPIIVWVSKFYSATLTVESLDPQFTYGRLVEDTEVHVKQLNTERDVANENILSATPHDWSAYKMPTVEIFRGIVLTRINLKNSLLAPYHVFLKKSDASIMIQQNMKDDKSVFCKISKLCENDKNANFSSKSDSMDADVVFYVKLFVIDENNDEFEDSVFKENFTINGLMKNLFITPELSMNVKLKCGGKLRVEIVKHRLEEDISSLEVYPVTGKFNKQDVINYIQNRSGHNLLLLNTNNYLKLDNDCICNLKILPITCAFGLFDFNRVNQLKINIHKNVLNIDNLELYLNLTSQHQNVENIHMSIIDPIIHECINSLTLKPKICYFKDVRSKSDNTLICGSTGSGKTTICQILQSKLNDSPYYIHTVMINCTTMKGKKAETIQKILTAAINECVYYQWSVLILDNIEYITKYSLNQEENNMDFLHPARVTEIIFELMTETQDMHNISLVATCSNYNSIGEKLKTFQGNHFFQTILNIPELEKKDRADITRQLCLFKTNISADINWEYFGNISHGWVYQDFAIFAEKAAFIAWKRHAREGNKGTLSIEECDLRNCLEKYSPVNLHDIKLHKNEGYNWSDIGGLRQVKTVLTEILYWPLKYGNLFKNSPIKHQSGILLYGMPGVGKTMIAGSIAKEFGLNLISVKGPELLSKYIGASEEAVRNVFQKAQTAKPCVLFFDEFDSLAPRRGHDNTGVTDRVVNQILTQLDGVEGREGVAIVAATSRPDLIDPAILRPGRLDKLLLCPLPDEADRKEIFSILSKTYKIEINDNEINILAAVTDGFTGADLNMLFKQAKLNILQRTADNELKRNALSVTYEDILQALAIVKSSIPLTEKNLLSNIYDKFSKNCGIQEDVVKGTKITLA